jgi:DmsE family decaheme c-type cytochrome
MGTRISGYGAIAILVAIVAGAGAGNTPAENALAETAPAATTPADSAPTQEYPRVSSVCFECHDEMAPSLDNTAHSLSSSGKNGAGPRIACTDCHVGDRRHWEVDPDEFPMTSPAKLPARDEAQLCMPCHQTSHQQNMVERNVHLTSNINCSACHSVHEAKEPVLLRVPQTTLCLDCHRGVEGSFAKPYRHPVNDGIVKCSECHMTLDLTRRELSRNGTNMCMKCHGEFEGPFLHEHQATVDYSTEEGGCIACHEPHGSNLPRMLNQPYEGPHFQLCSQCHSVPRHNSNIQHGTMWAGVPCSDCHTDIHGSYDNRLFVSEALKSQGCFEGSCHSL